MSVTDDTWGISGPVFLTAYVVVAVVIAVAGHRARRALADPRPDRPLGAPLDPARVAHLAACAAAVGAPLVSEHVAFVRAGGCEAGHLLRLPRTREALDVLTANVRRVRAELDVPLALEPIASLFDWPEDELTEGEFLTELLERTGALLLLLDVANVYANAVNRGTDAEALLDAVPLDRVAYVHVAGGSGLTACAVAHAAAATSDGRPNASYTPPVTSAPGQWARDQQQQEAPCRA